MSAESCWRATLIAIFLIPVTYYVVERFADRRRSRAPRRRLRALARIEWKRYRTISSVCTPRVSVSRQFTPVAILLSVNNDAFCKLIGAFC